MDPLGFEKHTDSFLSAIREFSIKSSDQKSFSHQATEALTILMPCVVVLWSRGSIFFKPWKPILGKLLFPNLNCSILFRHFGGIPLQSPWSKWWFGRYNLPTTYCLANSCNIHPLRTVSLLRGFGAVHRFVAKTTIVSMSFLVLIRLFSVWFHPTMTVARLLDQKLTVKTARTWQKCKYPTLGKARLPTMNSPVICFVVQKVAHIPIYNSTLLFVQSKSQSNCHLVGGFNPFEKY